MSKMFKLFIFAVFLIAALPVCSFFLFSVLSEYSDSENKVILSLGDYSEIGFYTSGGFQDYTDYAKYNIESPMLDNNLYFKQVTPDSKENLTDHIDNFERWVFSVKESDEKNSLVQNYDFDKSVISESDFLYIYDDPDYPRLGCYNIYFLDSETNILYYFHNNI